MEHECTVCLVPFTFHNEDCDHCNGSHWPPLCCPGCRCESFERAHPDIKASSHLQFSEGDPVAFRADDGNAIAGTVVMVDPNDERWPYLVQAADGREVWLPAPALTAVAAEERPDVPSLGEVQALLGQLDVTADQLVREQREADL